MLRTHISNQFLKEDKVVTAKTQQELDQKVRNQINRWKEKEEKVKAQQRIDQMKHKVNADTEAALDLINQYLNLLKSSFGNQHRLNWQNLYQRDSFDKPEPSLSKYIESMGVPKEDKFTEFFFSSIRNKRLDKEKEAELRYQEAFCAYQNAKNAFLEEQRDFNVSVDYFKQAYEEKITPFVERYFETVLDNSIYPAGMVKHFDIQYQSEPKNLVVDFDLPHPEIVPNVIEYKFVQTKKETTTKTMKKKEFDEFYEDVIFQIVIRTVYECLNADYKDTIDLIVFNGWIHGVDTSTGQDFHSCIVSLQASKEEVLALQLDKVVPKDCFRNLKGLNASALIQLAPVRPILEIDKDDKRFVESKEILAGINSIPNLAAMPWEDFEHLVRELFTHYFSQIGCEVRVTKASRDGGIDAVAFDPDPIRGGKYIIQAKKYNHVVPISAVRELNGIMADEGAVKGILVTTSYYGNDSREFVKGKPLTLLDGQNLIQMFNDFGYNVRIELKKNDKSS